LQKALRIQIENPLLAANEGLFHRFRYYAAKQISDRDFFVREGNLVEKTAFLARFW
jgi:hypothetical protein